MATTQVTSTRWGRTPRSAPVSRRESPARGSTPLAFPGYESVTHTSGVSTPPAPVAATTPTSTTVAILPWSDPLIDRSGHDPRSAYAERFWLSVIGPTAGWIMRRLADLFDESPDGFELDLGHTASTMGLSYERGPGSPFGRALNRCVMFGLAHPLSSGFAVRRRLPEVATRHLQRLPTDVQAEHAEWARRTTHLNVREIERRLREIGVSPAAAARACEAAALAS